MFGLDAYHLARIQFAFTVSFHIIFPAITIGLASYLAVLEGLWLKSKNPVWRSLYHFWSKIFAVNFGMGVVSGLVMAYQFGTNWSGFSEFAGSITGPLLTYEVLTAFFLEAGFLGVMLFGWNKVGPGLHFFSTCMVALGTLISTFWILASNSWMQTPQGFEIVNGQVVPVDWFAVIFNPSFPYRLLHMSVAAFLSSALFVGASAAWHLLRGNTTPAIRTMFSMANPLQDKMRSVAKKLLLALLLSIAIISLWTPLAHPAIADRWFTLPNLGYLLPVPVLVIAFSVWLWRTLGRPENHTFPFVLTLGLIFLGFSGLGISIWPHIIPPSVTLWQAAAPAQSQGFMLVGALLIIPVILVYTFWSYYVFRGKVQHGEGYH